MQFDSIDPVTRDRTRLVVPAELGIDVDVDVAPVEAHAVTRAPVEEEEKLAPKAAVPLSNVKGARARGNAILSQAPPPEPPPAHFRAPRRGQSAVSGCKEKTTFSMFIKARGRDKFSDSRLREIDALAARHGIDGRATAPHSVGGLLTMPPEVLRSIPRGTSSGGTGPARWIDPHVRSKGMTQRLHANWPEKTRQELAKGLYATKGKSEVDSPCRLEVIVQSGGRGRAVVAT